MTNVEIFVYGLETREELLNQVRSIEENLELYEVERWVNHILRMVRKLNSIPEYLSWIDPEDNYLSLLKRDDLNIRVGYAPELFHDPNSFLIILEVLGENYQSHTFSIPVENYLNPQYLWDIQLKFQEDYLKSSQYKEYLRLKAIYEG